MNRMVIFYGNLILSMQTFGIGKIIAILKNTEVNNTTLISGGMFLAAAILSLIFYKKD